MGDVGKEIVEGLSQFAADLEAAADTGELTGYRANKLTREQVQADLAAWGIDTTAATRKVLDAVRKREGADMGGDKATEREPRYLVYRAPNGPLTLCGDSLAAASEEKAKRGGLVYEPLGVSAAERIAREPDMGGDELRAAEKACEVIESCPPEVMDAPAGRAEIWMHARRLAKLARIWLAAMPTDSELGVMAADVIAWYEGMKSHGAGWDELAHKIVSVARTLLARLPAADGWRPIHTAPKDGTHFLAYKAGTTTVCFVGTASVLDGAGERPVETVRMFPSRILWNPTHWMPLPAPPTALGG